MSDSTVLPNKYTSGLFKDSDRAIRVNVEPPKIIEFRKIKDDAPWPGELEGHYVWDDEESQYKFEKASNEESTS